MRESTWISAEVVLHSQTVHVRVRVSNVPHLAGSPAQGVVPGSSVILPVLREAKLIINLGLGAQSSVVVQQELQVGVLPTLGDKLAEPSAVLSAVDGPVSSEHSHRVDHLLQPVGRVVDFDLATSEVLHGVSSEDRSLTVTLAV